jgi:hypothetical protein
LYVAEVVDQEVVMESPSTAPATEYEPPTIVATFPKTDLVGELPEDLTPHVHATQNS